MTASRCSASSWSTPECNASGGNGWVNGWQHRVAPPALGPHQTKKYDNEALQGVSSAGQKKHEHTLWAALPSSALGRKYNEGDRIWNSGAGHTHRQGWLQKVELKNEMNGGHSHRQGWAQEAKLEIKGGHSHRQGGHNR
eukprot:1161913-Pelagomonas_calceolata.AAC.9